MTSHIASTFVDDFKALAAGGIRIASALLSEATSSILESLTNPVEKIARACDVAGVLESRAASQKLRHAEARASSADAPIRFDVFGIRSSLRALSRLT